jgi:hypothetical protein
LETLQASCKESEEINANGQSGQAFLLWTRTILESRYMVPRTHFQTVLIYPFNGSINLKNSEAMEIKQLAEYKTCLENGKYSTAPIAYENIQCHMVYNT